MAKYCPYCGSEIEADFKFCPECGKSIPATVKGKKAEKEKKPEKVETKEKKETKEKAEVKEKEKPKGKPKLKLKLPKIKLKIPKKTAIIIVAIICIVAVASATTFVAINNNWFGATVVQSEERTFTINVTNELYSDVECYLTIDNLRQTEYGHGFTLNSSETKVLTIDEDNLLYPGRSAYRISLFADLEYEEFDTATAVTQYADFLIDEENLLQYVECTGFS